MEDGRKQGWSQRGRTVSTGTKLSLYCSLREKSNTSKFYRLFCRQMIDDTWSMLNMGDKKWRYIYNRHWHVIWADIPIEEECYFVQWCIYKGSHSVFQPYCVVLVVLLDTLHKTICDLSPLNMRFISWQKKVGKCEWSRLWWLCVVPEHVCTLSLSF